MSKHKHTKRSTRWLMKQRVVKLSADNNLLVQHTINIGFLGAGRYKVSVWLQREGDTHSSDVMMTPAEAERVARALLRAAGSARLRQLAARREKPDL